MSSFASRYKNTYIPHWNLWINQLYFEISNSRQKQCLTTDTRDVNEVGPGKFRIQADSGTEKICYYNRNKKDTSPNSFLAIRKKTSSPIEINLSIVKVIDNTNRHNSISYETSDELIDFKNDNVQPTNQQTSESQSVRETATARPDRRRRGYIGNGQVSKKPIFFQDNNALGKR